MSEAQLKQVSSGRDRGEMDELKVSALCCCCLQLRCRKSILGLISH